MQPVQNNSEAQSAAADFRAIATGLRSSDQQLAQRCLTDLVCVLHPKLAAWLKRRKGIADDSRINDILQATWHNVWQARLEIDVSQFCQAWVFRICLNCLINSSRDKKKRAEVRLTNLFDPLFAVHRCEDTSDDVGPSQIWETRQQAILNEISKWSSVDQSIIWTWANSDGEEWTAKLSLDTGRKPATLRKRLFDLKERLRKVAGQPDSRSVVSSPERLGFKQLPPAEQMGSAQNDAKGRYDNHG